jgi:hypothetical protein
MLGAATNEADCVRDSVESPHIDPGTKIGIEHERRPEADPVVDLLRGSQTYGFLGLRLAQRQRRLGRASARDRARTGF